MIKNITTSYITSINCLKPKNKDCFSKQKVYFNTQPDCFIKSTQIKNKVTFKGLKYTELEQKALNFATDIHKGLYRKTPLKKIPYIEHCKFVGDELKKKGFNENVVAAGFLHDTVEDAKKNDKKVTFNILAKEFNPEVAKFVFFVSHNPDIKSWEQKQKSYKDKIIKAPPESQAISAYDKIYNMKADIETIANDINIFNSLASTPEKNLEKHKLLLNSYNNLDNRIKKEYIETLKEYKTAIDYISFIED